MTELPENIEELKNEIKKTELEREIGEPKLVIKGNSYIHYGSDYIDIQTDRGISVDLEELCVRSDNFKIYRYSPNGSEYHRGYTIKQV